MNDRTTERPERMRRSAPGDRQEPDPPPLAIPENPMAERIVGAAFVAALLAGFGLLGVYLLGGQTQVEAILLTICLGGIGAGIIVWSQALLPNRIVSETRHPLRSDPDEEG